MSVDQEGKPNERSFEEAIARLEEIVQRLETGNIALDESLNLFEEGIGLAKYCSERLDAAEGRLQVLMGFENGQPKLGEFNQDGE
ncbi:MAG: exodeoxyribonuclease VII small subunit [Bacteroidota bacterium]